MTRSRDVEALGLLMPVLERPDARSDPGLFAEALVTAGFAQCAVTWRRHGGSGNRGCSSPVNMATTGCSSNPSRHCAPLTASPVSLARGLPLGQESVERARRLGDDVVLGRSLMAYLLVSDLIDPGHCGQLFTEAIACTERSGDRLVSHFLHHNAGVHALRAGDIPAARAHLEQAAQGLQAIDGVLSHFVTLNLGWVLRQESDPDGARSMFEAGLRISRRNRDRIGSGLRQPRPGVPGRGPGRLASGR